MCEDNLKKIWVIRCIDTDKGSDKSGDVGDDKSGDMGGDMDGDMGSGIILGGICVHQNGYILTNALNIDTENQNLELVGRSYGRSWHKLKVFSQKKEFNLTLLEVKEEVKKEVKEEDKGEVKFPYFVLEGEVSLHRGTILFGIFHCDRIPFSSNYGFSCRPFNSENVEFPVINDTDSEYGDSVDYRLMVRTESIIHLCLGHVIHLGHLVHVHGEGDGRDEGEKDDESEKDESNDDVDPGQQKDDEGGKGDGGFYSDDESNKDERLYDNDKDERDYDNDFGYGSGFDPNLIKLDVRMPLIQASRLGSSMGCLGCPVFDDKWELVGLYNFSLGVFQYITPKQLLNMFFTHAIASGEEYVGYKEKGKRRKIEDDSPPEYKAKKKRHDIQENVGEKCEKDTKAHFKTATLTSMDPC